MKNHEENLQFASYTRSCFDKEVFACSFTGEHIVAWSPSGEGRSPSAMISSTVTWCRPTVKPLPTKFAPAWLEPELLPPPPPPPEAGPELTNSRRESKNFLMMSSVNFRPAACSLCTELWHWRWCATDWKPKRPVHQPFGAHKYAVMSFPATMMLRPPRCLGKFPFARQGKPVGESGCGWLLCKWITPHGELKHRRRKYFFSDPSSCSWLAWLVLLHLVQPLPS